MESNVADMRRVLSGAGNRLANTGQPTILFIDEIHRFSKSQQDVLLPDVESGVVKLIGATTHNPFFFVNSPLVSRSQIFELQPLSEDELLDLIARALSDAGRGLGYLKLEIQKEAARTSPGSPTATRARRSTPSKSPRSPHRPIRTARFASRCGWPKRASRKRR